MKKFILDLTVTENIRLNANYVLLKLTSQSLLPEMLPGQFAELRVDGSPTTFLRRPISINFVDKQRNEVWFLIQLVGDGTRRGQVFSQRQFEGGRRGQGGKGGKGAFLR
jgi:dihydroorotate dehydrogenase electron transfer subunit